MSSGKQDSASNKVQNYSEVELAGSHFALQVALQTMKERCQRLQQRISFLEEENSRLKLQKPDDNSQTEAQYDCSSDTTKIQTEQLKEQVSQLTRQKSQLSHQIIMVVTENKQLWNRLSHMTKINQSLGGHLSKISDTLNQHTSGSYSNSPVTSKGRNTSSKIDVHATCYVKLDNETCKATGKPFSSQLSTNEKGATDGSLEEISLKLLNSIQLEKSELEHQYAQMVEIHNDTSPSFNLNTMGLSFIYQDESQAVKVIKDHCKDLEKMKQSLVDQQVILKSAVTKFTSLKEAQSKNCCHNCLRKLGKYSGKEKLDEDSNNINSSKLMEEEEKKLKEKWPSDTEEVEPDGILPGDQKDVQNTTGNKDHTYICPMCGMKWSSSAPFEVFQKHVTDHFPSDDSEFSSLGKDFEGIP